MRKTDKQERADLADMKAFALADMLEDFSAKHSEPDFAEAAKRIRSARALIRSHMHPRDIEATS